MTLTDLYEHEIKSLPPADRLRLAALILNDITSTSATTIDESDQWGDDDYADFSRSAWNHIEQQEQSGG